MVNLNSIKFKVKWSLLLILLVITWLVNIAASAIAQSVELSTWAEATVVLVARVSGTAVLVLGLVLIGSVALAVFRFLVKLFPSMFEFAIENKEEEKAEEVVDQAKEVSLTLEELSHRLNDIEANRGQAIMKLQDAHVLATTLVALIRRTMAKARDLVDAGQLLEDALDALVSGDQMAIRRAAGALNDQHIRDLLLDTNGDDRYRESVLNLMATQTGALRSQSAALSQLSNRWIETLTIQRAQTARLAVVIDALDAARPIATIDTNLKIAQSFLMMQGQPELHQIAAALPAAGAARPMLDGYQ